MKNQYNLASFAGAVSMVLRFSLGTVALSQGLINLLIFHDTRWVVWVALTAVSVAVLVSSTFVLVNTAWAMGNERRREEAEIAAITPETKRLAEQASMLWQISKLSNSQAEYAKRLDEVSTFEIQGSRVVWILDGMRVPIEFAYMWDAEWTKRRQDGQDDFLPAQSDFANHPRRDVLREYNRALTNELVKLGAVRWAESRYPPRWVFDNWRMRTQALRDIGFYKALQFLDQEE